MMTEQELSERLKPVPSIWLLAEERMCLLKYAGLSQGNIVEIGAGWGGSACILVLGSNQDVISVDPMEPPLCQVDGWDITADKVESKVKEVIGQTERWALVEVTSKFFAESVVAENWDGPWKHLGLVFIDGNHDYSFVRQDVDLWLPLIRQRGFLILHDSCRDPNQPEGSNLCGYPGPTQVAQELTTDPRVKLIETAYSTTVWEVQ